MKYVEFINQTIRKKILEPEKILLYGQNIAAGSCLSGLTRGLEVKAGRIINTPNCENTLCGIGFGAMMNGVSAIFFMKQLDFLLLGIDQLVNTYNIVRRKAPTASFTIFPVIVDSGYEGPQSSLNNLGDFCSMARIPGYTINTQVEATEIIEHHLISPGFRILGVSQRLFKTEIMDLAPVAMNAGRSLFQYSSGADVTIICHNFSLPYGLEFQKRLLEKGVHPSLFSVNGAMPISWDEVITDVSKTKKVIVIDDSKSMNPSWQGMLNILYVRCRLSKCVLVQRSFSGYYCRPQHDQLEIDYERVIGDLKF